MDWQIGHGDLSGESDPSDWLGEGVDKLTNWREALGQVSRIAYRRGNGGWWMVDGGMVEWWSLYIVVLVILVILAVLVVLVV